MAPGGGSAGIVRSMDQLSLTEGEVEFLAEDEVVKIVPNFSMNPMELTCGTVGPFRPQMESEVPLWLALALKRKQRCSIVTPPWMALENLVDVLEAEHNGEAFQPLPFHYLEIATLLFEADTTGQEVPNFHEVRIKMQEIKDVRQSKIEAGMKKLTSATSAVKLTNLGAMEVTLVRPFFSAALAHLSKLDSAANASQADTPDQ